MNIDCDERYPVHHLGHSSKHHHHSKRPHRLHHHSGHYSRSQGKSSDTSTSNTHPRYTRDVNSPETQGYILPNNVYNNGRDIPPSDVMHDEQIFGEEFQAGFVPSFSENIPGKMRRVKRQAVDETTTRNPSDSMSAIEDLMKGFDPAAPLPKKKKGRKGGKGKKNKKNRKKKNNNNRSTTTAFTTVTSSNSTTTIPITTPPPVEKTSIHNMVKFPSTNIENNEKKVTFESVDFEIKSTSPPTISYKDTTKEKNIDSSRTPKKTFTFDDYDPRPRRESFEEKQEFNDNTSSQIEEFSLDESTKKQNPSFSTLNLNNKNGPNTASSTDNLELTSTKKPITISSTSSNELKPLVTQTKSENSNLNLFTSSSTYSVESTTQYYFPEIIKTKPTVQPGIDNNKENIKSLTETESTTAKNNLKTNDETINNKSQKKRKGNVNRRKKNGKRKNNQNNKINFPETVNTSLNNSSQQPESNQNSKEDFDSEVKDNKNNYTPSADSSEVKPSHSSNFDISEEKRQANSNEPTFDINLKNEQKIDSSTTLFYTVPITKIDNFLSSTISPNTDTKIVSNEEKRLGELNTKLDNTESSNTTQKQRKRKGKKQKSNKSVKQPKNLEQSPKPSNSRKAKQSTGFSENSKPDKKVLVSYILSKIFG